MSVARYILKGDVQIVGMVERNELDQIIRQELNGYTLDQVGEYSGLLYQDDHYTLAYLWDTDLLTHREKNTADLLEEAKVKKIADLKEYSIILAKQLYDFIRSTSEVKFAADLRAHIEPAAKLPLTGDLATLAGYRSTFITKRTEINALTTISEVEAYDLTTGW